MFNWAKTRIQNWLGITDELTFIKEGLSLRDKYFQEKDFVAREEFEKTIELLQSDLEGEMGDFVEKDDFEETVNDCISDSYVLGEIEDDVKDLKSDFEGLEAEISDNKDEVDDGVRVLARRIDKIEKALKTLSDNNENSNKQVSSTMS